MNQNEVKVDVRMNYIRKGVEMMFKDVRQMASITNVLNDSMLKRGGFDMQKKMRFDAVAADAQGARKQITGITDVLNQSLSKRGGFDMQKKFRFDAVAAGAKRAGRDIANSLKQAEKAAKQFKFEWLGVMFAGMAMQRAFMGILRASFQTWSSVTEGTSKAGGAMTQLQAAWEFFKFSLFDALVNSGLFEFFVSGILKLVELWGNLSTKTQGWVAGLVVAGAVVGTILFVAGQLMLGLHSISLLLFGQNLSWGLISTKVSTVVKLITGSMIPAIKSAGAAMWAALTPAILVGWITGIIAVIGVLILLTKKFGSVGAALKAWASAIALTIVGLFQFVLQGVETVIDTILVMIANLADQLASIAFELGWDTLGEKANKLAKSIGKLAQSTLTPDLLKETSIWLDKQGFNPQPVGEQGTTTQPTHIIVDNTDELARAISSYEKANPAPKTQSGNLFTDEMNRQGYGYLL